MSSRERLVDTMRDLLSRQGYAATGLNQLVAESGSPKGSIYHFFPGGKEQIAAEAVTRAGVEAAAATSLAFANTATAAEAVDAIVGWLGGQLRDSDFRYGCSIAATALQVDAGSERLRLACADAFTTWLDALSDGLTDAGWAPGEARSRATVALASIEGALVLSRAQRSLWPLDHVRRQLSRDLSIDLTAGLAGDLTATATADPTVAGDTDRSGGTARAR